MPNLNQLIASSGERFYENARKGFIERPEEARKRRLEEATLTGMGQQQSLRDLQIQSEQNKAAEYLAEKDVRDKTLQAKENEAESLLASQEKASQWTAQQADPAWRGATDTERAEIARSSGFESEYQAQQAQVATIMKDQATVEKLKAETSKFNSETELEEQARKDDEAMGLVSIMLGKYGNDPAALSKALNEQLGGLKDLASDAGDDEFDRLSKMKGAQLVNALSEVEKMFPAYQDAARKVWESSAKAKAKGKGKLSPKLLTADEVETKMEVLMSKDPRIEGSGNLGELSADDTAEYKTDVISVAKQLMEAVAKKGEVLDHSTALEMAFERVGRELKENTDWLSTNKYTYSGSK